MNKLPKLFSVKKFQQAVCNELQCSQNDSSYSEESVDISTKELSILSKYELVEQSILSTLNGGDEDLALEDISQKLTIMESIRNNAVVNLKSYKVFFDPSIRKKKKIEKEVNYVNQSVVNNSEIPILKDLMVTMNDIVLSVAIYHPLKRHKKSQEFLLLGSQPLTALRDVIDCASDKGIGAENTRFSAFFFIENVFYNDLRHENSIDYSESIIKWVNERNRYTHPGLGLYSSNSMERTLFNDLSIRIGFQYLYCHQGNCEHFIVFTELRSIKNSDPKNKSLYPLQTFQGKLRRKKCRICNIYNAKYIVYDDYLSPESPCLYCENCYIPFHYDADGRILHDDFRVYEYLHS